MFSNIRNKCIHCGGDHAPGPCPMKTCLQATQNVVGYQTYDNGVVTGKANANHLPSFSSKNGQQTAANMTPSSPKNSVGAQRRPSCAREPITPQVSPNTSQQNFYSVPPVHPQTIMHHLLIFQSHSRHPLSHLLMHIQPLCQTFQPNDKCRDARKLKHHRHRDCAGENNDAICRCPATNHTDGS